MPQINLKLKTEGTPHLTPTRKKKHLLFGSQSYADIFKFPQQLQSAIISQQRNDHLIGKR